MPGIACFPRSLALAASFVLASALPLTAQSAHAKHHGTGGSRTVSHVAPLTNQERTLQVLDRFTFGARPEDPALVAAAGGPEAWFEKQLDPDSIDDSALNKRLTQYPALGLPTDQLIYNFPPRRTIKQVADGKQPMPTDPMLAGLYQTLLYKYDAKQEVKQANQAAAATPSTAPQPGRTSAMPGQPQPAAAQPTDVYKRQPQAMLGWVLGALLALCDGLVWAELGAALPEAGGSYAYLREIYGPGRFGRLVSFLYVWQFTLSAPLVMASGAIGLSLYASYLYPSLSAPLASSGPLHHVHRTNLLAVVVVVLVVTLLYRRLRAIKVMAWVLWAGVIATLGITIVAGLSHFDARLAFSFPAGAFQLNHHFFVGLGAAMLIASYDYWGYYNISYLAGEVRDPGRTLPRTILGSIVIIAAVYLLMNISVLGVIPWQEFTAPGTSASHTAVIAVLLGRSFGPVWAKVGAWLVIWTAFGSLFSLLLGASRVPWAAAAEGNYFRPLARLHPTGRFPARVLLMLGGIACACCFFDLKAIIAALVALRIVLQFLLQQVGVVLLRRRRPDLPRPFRIWLYPLPVILATIGFVFVLVSRPHAGREISAALVVTISGFAAYLWRARRDAAWPFAHPTE